MAKRKRSTASRSGFINQAVKAGRTALKNVQKQVPPDLRRTIEGTGRSFEKTFSAGMKQIQAQLSRMATKADIDRLSKRMDRLEQSGRSTARRATGAASRARTSAKGTVTRTRRTAAKRTASTARRASRTADKAADGGSS